VQPVERVLALFLHHVSRFIHLLPAAFITRSHASLLARRIWHEFSFRSGGLTQLRNKRVSKEGMKFLLLFDIFEFVLSSQYSIHERREF
jgi:hypothetical protein